MTDSDVFRLKVQKIEQTCLFELSWGKGQQLSCTVNYPHSLTNLYQEWQRIYLSFYKSGLRGRLEDSGTIEPPPIDWHSKLVQAEAKLLYEFHHWLRSAELFEIRSTIAKGVVGSGEKVNVFLTCTPLELARLPWEAWEIGAEFARDAGLVRIVRTPNNIRKYCSEQQRNYRRKPRILAILGDDTGLNFQADRSSVLHCSKVADIEFVGWQPGKSISELKEKICATLVDERGWDVLFFAGHSNETQLTGGELAIAPNTSLSIKEITPYLQIAKARGLKFALFNSCSGMNIAESLIDLGLSQVVVMREPVHNSVAQTFILKFLQGMAEHKDVHEATIAASQYLKLDYSLTYPSAFLIPSLFCHPDAVLFQIPPSGWKLRLKRILPTKTEAIALLALSSLSLLHPVQDFLLEKRILAQAVYRQLTGQLPKVTPPPVLLVQIDEKSIKQAKIVDPKPMNRFYLASLVDKLRTLQAKVVGIDYLLDRQHGKSDRQLSQSLKAAVQQPQPTWFVFASVRDDNEGWLNVLPDIASPNWSLQGSINLSHWYVGLVPEKDSIDEKLPFAYLLALAYKLNVEELSFKRIPPPQLTSQTNLFFQVTSSLKKTKRQSNKSLFYNRTQLQPITSFSYDWGQMWLHPIIDFSIPPSRVYQRIPAIELLRGTANSPSLRHLQRQVVIIAPGGYGEAGVFKEGEDNYPLPVAVSYWLNSSRQNAHRSFTGGEAHAYLVHHYLKSWLVVPIPDIWIIGIAVLLGKVTALYEFRVSTFVNKRQRLVVVLLSGTAIYGLVCLQVYILDAILLPWFLPTAMFWIYVLPSIARKKFMGKQNLLKFVLLLFVWVIPVGEGHTIAEASSGSQESSQGDIPGGSRVQLPWEELYQKNPPRTAPPAGSRGYFCTIAPSVPGDVKVIWSDRPLFLWNGSIASIELRPQGSDRVLWSQTVKENQNSLMYGGEVLQPGVSYDWVMFDNSYNPIGRVTFQVMSASERERITSDLNRLEAQLKQEGATEEKMAYAKAEYFASLGMWVDALQQMYAVKNPSSALSKFIQTVPERFCQQ